MESSGVRIAEIIYRRKNLDWTVDAVMATSDGGPVGDKHAP